MSSNPWTDPEWKAFAAHYAGQMPKLVDSAIFLSLVPLPESELDMQYCLEIGASVLLNKPFLVLAHPGRPIPEKLRRVADMILEIDLKASGASAKFNAGLEEFTRKFVDKDQS